MLLILAYYVIRALQLLILVSAVISWFRPDPRNPIVKVVHAVVDPLLHPIQVVIPAIGGMDFSPLVAFLLLSFLQRMIIPDATFF